MEPNVKNSDIEAALEAGKQLAVTVQDYFGAPYAIIPKSMEFKKLDALMVNPERIRHTVYLSTTESFLEYFNRFAQPESVIACDMQASLFTGIIDYHPSTGAPAWCEHKVIYTCPTTQEWDTWNKTNGEKMEQLDFAYFIEQNLDDIVEPAAAQMLEIVLTLKAKTKVAFESGQRLSNGEIQFQYREEAEGRAGAKGDLKIPETFMLGLRVFEKGEAYHLAARFRYRINGGKMVMWYDLVRPHKVHDSAVDDIYQAIKAEAKAALILHGTL